MFLIGILEKIISLLENQADLLAILIFVFASEFLALLSTIRIKKVRVVSGLTSRHLKQYEIVVFPILIIFGFMLTLIKNFILFASYNVSMNFVGLEPLLSLIVVVLMVHLLLVLKHETKFGLILLFSIVFGVIYVLNVDSFSQKIFTDRILAATYVVETGIYPSGFLDKAYDPIPFDVAIYSFLALILGIEPASILVFLIYPTLSLTITYAITWLLMVRYTGGIEGEHNVIKIAFIIIFLSQMSCWTLTITGHEALWSAWLLITLSEYSLLKILGNRKAEYSTTFVFLIFVLASLFYHITVSTILLSLIIAFIIFMHIYGFQAIRIKVLFSLFVISAVLSFIKTYFIAGYPFSAFFSLLKTMLSLQVSEELAIYVRANILKGTNIYLRYAQSSSSLVVAIGLASILFYIVRFFITETVKGKNINETVISLSLSSTGLILLLISLLSIFVQGSTYSTTFLRPAFFLLLLGAIPYVVEKAKIICSNRKLFLIQAIMLIVIVGLAVNDVGVTPRKGLYSPFVYVNSLDLDNLRYLNYVINNGIAITGYPEASMYSGYLNIKYNYNLTSIGSAKNIRQIYMDLYENQRIQDYLHRSLLVSINEFSIRPMLSMLDEYSQRIYDSNIYVIHYIS